LFKKLPINTKKLKRYYAGKWAYSENAYLFKRWDSSIFLKDGRS
jgi:hypothetical protein